MSAAPPCDGGRVTLVFRRHVCSVLLPVQTHRLPPSLSPGVSIPRGGAGDPLGQRLLQTSQSVLSLRRAQPAGEEESLALRGAGLGLAAGGPVLQAERGQSAR